MVVGTADYFSIDCDVDSICYEFQDFSTREIHVQIPIVILLTGLSNTLKILVCNKNKPPCVRIRCLQLVSRIGCHIV